MFRMVSNRFAAGTIALALAGLAGCGDPAAPPRPAPIAMAAIEIRTLGSLNPPPEYDATVQLTASVALHATGSHDPAGQSLVYEWSDTVDGVRTADFYPSNPVRTRELVYDTGLSTEGVHEIMLTVIAQDGRKARTTLRVLVTACDCGGVP